MLVLRFTCNGLGAPLRIEIFGSP